MKIPSTQVFLSFCLIASGCAGTSQLKRGNAVSLVGSYQVERYTLDNGLKLLVVEDHSSPTFAYQTWYNVGSKDETPGQTGLAHLFEHMMFKQTKNLKEGEFDRILESAGAEGENAFTSRDYTAYVQELPSDKLDLIAKLEADRMVNLIVDQKAFKTETEVVQNERRYRNENSPDGLMYQEIFGLAFKKHPYRWPVIGYQEDLDGMSSKDAEAFYKKFYSPDRASVIVVGDVDPMIVLKTVQKHYGHIPAQAAPMDVAPAEPEQTSSRAKTLKLNIQIQKMMMGYRVPQMTHEDAPALSVLQSVLGGGKSSRLHRALVDSGITSSVETYDLEDKDPSLFLITANMQKGKTARQAEKVILRVLAEIAEKGVTEQEVERAKNGLSFAFYQELSSNSEKARFLGRYSIVANDFTAGVRLHEKRQSVTAGDVQSVAKKYFKPVNRSVIVGVPK